MTVYYRSTYSHFCFLFPGPPNFGLSLKQKVMSYRQEATARLVIEVIPMKCDFSESMELVSGALDNEVGRGHPLQVVQCCGCKGKKLFITCHQQRIKISGATHS